MSDTNEGSAAPPPSLDESDRYLATVIAMHVRNQLEQIHGGGNRLDLRDQGGEDKGLTDEQMREINPIVRNAVADVLHAMKHRDRPAAQQLLTFTKMMIPDYWEPAELSESYTDLDWSKDDSEHSSCRHCGQPVIRRPGEKSWAHNPQPTWNDPDPRRFTNVRCRSASFNRLGDWDESLARYWRATPAQH